LSIQWPQRKVLIQETINHDEDGNLYLAITVDGNAVFTTKIHAEAYDMHSKAIRALDQQVEVVSATCLALLPCDIETERIQQ